MATNDAQNRQEPDAQLMGNAEESATESATGSIEAANRDIAAPDAAAPTLPDDSVDAPALADSPDAPVTFSAPQDEPPSVAAPAEDATEAGDAPEGEATADPSAGASVGPASLPVDMPAVDVNDVTSAPSAEVEPPETSAETLAETLAETPAPDPAPDPAPVAEMARPAPLAPAPLAPARGDGAPLLPLLPGVERILPLRMTPLRLPRRPRLDVWGWLVVAMTLILLPGILALSLWPTIGAASPVSGPPDNIPRGATEWVNASARTPLDPVDSGFGALSYPVDPQFVTAYEIRGGASAMGAAITPAFECNLGVAQFFAAGALLHQTRFPSASAVLTAGDLDPALATAGVRDVASGDVWLPLSQALLSVGSAADIGSGDDGTNYATLRAATDAHALVTAPASAGRIHANTALPQTLTLASGVFVVEGTRGGKHVGHAIPAPIWQFINQPQTAPDGWLDDIGAPLTEALPITNVDSDGATHHLLTQAFWQAIIVTDLDSPIQATWLEPVGLDYLRTLGAPTARVSAGAQRWTTQSGALRTAAGASATAVSLGATAPVTLTGDTKWQGGALWYAARWSTPSRSGEAWVADAALTTNRPTGMLYAGIDALSPGLANYLANKGGTVGVVAYDITRNTTYTYNSTGLFTMASSAKVPLMISYLTNIESAGRGPNGYELSVLTAMIEHSDNNAAQVIYDTLGDQSGQQYYLRKWGIYDYTPNVNGWGWAEWSPSDMAHLLTLLEQGKVLNSADRALAFHLMRSIESDQRFGVGDSAPSGANVAMKDGWVPEPDGWWAVNSSGIVIVGSETYIVTVYTRDQASFGAGQNIVNYVAGAIGQALT